jgi:hypothetical protein
MIALNSLLQMIGHIVHRVESKMVAVTCANDGRRLLSVFLNITADHFSGRKLFSRFTDQRSSTSVPVPLETQAINFDFRF